VIVAVMSMSSPVAMVVTVVMVVVILQQEGGGDVDGQAETGDGDRSLKRMVWGCGQGAGAIRSDPSSGRTLARAMALAKPRGR